MKRFLNLAMLLVMVLMANNTIAQHRVMTLTELPAVAQNFINSYFSQQQVVGVYQETEYFSKEYKVFLENGTEVEFSAKGEWEEVKSRTSEIPTQIIPAEITQHIQKQFPNNFVKEIKKKWYGYDVEISNGLDLEFNSKGQFLRIDD